MALSAAKARDFLYWKDSILRRHAALKFMPIIVGYGMSGDAFHITAARPKQVRDRGERDAKGDEDAGITPEQSVISRARNFNARITTNLKRWRLNKPLENMLTNSLSVQPNHDRDTRSARRAASKHVFSVLALHEKVFAPTVNYEFPAPECDLDYIPNEARSSGS
jgi:3-oxoacyl-(acyl-carrier-protein) synthase